MTKPTLAALGIFGGLILIGLIVVASGPDMPMLPGTIVAEPRLPAIFDMNDMPSGLPILASHMPEFVGISKWWNTPDGEPLTPEKLKGKVVLIDFWTYSCINCIRTYPFLRAMHEKYADKGLVIVGVHTPEFAFEKNPINVEREIKKNGLKHPIALDPDYATWNAYNNRYWPAEYFFDREGRLRRTHFGEGEYEESEDAIRALLAEDGMDVGEEAADVSEMDFSKIRTPETYFGLDRGNEFMGSSGNENQPIELTAAKTVSANRWTAGGTWTFHAEYVEANSQNAVFRFNVQATKLHLVMESADGTDKRVEIYVDGMKTGEMTVNESDLYDIASFPDAGRHTVELRLPDSGVRFYAATFS